MTFTNFENSLTSSREIELTTIGRKSGHESSRPVWFVEEGETLYLLPVTGSDSQWYKNLLVTPAIRLGTRGAELRARATPVTDPAKVAEVIDGFRAKYGARSVEQYYPKRDAAVEIQLVGS